MTKPIIKAQVNPYLRGLPEYLKKPESYDKVQKALLEAMATGCSHADPSEWFNCKKCTEKMLERRQLMVRLGFKSVEQYMEWRKVHELMRNPEMFRKKSPTYNKNADGTRRAPEEIEVSKKIGDQVAKENNEQQDTD
jgi:hypothetical protein